MPQLISCPECSKNLQVPEELIGKKVQCPECKNTFVATLPEPEDRSDPPPKTSTVKKKTTGGGVSKKTQKSYDDEDDDDDDRPRRRRRDDDDDDDDDYDRPSRRSRRGEEKPGKVTGIGVIALVGGILAIMLFFGLGAGSTGLCCLWPGTYYSLVVGILAIVKGSALLGSSAQANAPPIGIGVMMIVNIINLDITNVVLGILILVFCNDDEVKSYLRG